MYSDFTSTPVYNQPALRYPTVGVYSFFDIPMVLTSYTPTGRSPAVTAIEDLSRRGGGNVPWTGVRVGQGARTLGKLSLAGFIDTPMDTNNLPNIIRKGDSAPSGGGTNIFNVHYAELIAAAMEGRMVQYAQQNPVRIDPTYFRDPFGRVYTGITVLNFTANFMEQRPCRTNFTMNLQY